MDGLLKMVHRGTGRLQESATMWTLPDSLPVSIGTSPTQPPFEPQEEADLKFHQERDKVKFMPGLLMESYAWAIGKQVQLVPSPSFIARNQLAKGPQSISPVVIPALKCS